MSLRYSQFIVSFRYDKKQRNGYFWQLDAIIRTCRQNSDTLYGKYQRTEQFSGLDENIKFMMLQNISDEIGRWNALGNTLFSLMKSVSPENLEKYTNFTQYTSWAQEPVAQ